MKLNFSEMKFVEESGFLPIINEIFYDTRKRINIKKVEERAAVLFKDTKVALIEKIDSMKIDPDKKNGSRIA